MESKRSVGTISISMYVCNLSVSKHKHLEKCYQGTTEVFYIFPGATTGSFSIGLPGSLSSDARMMICVASPFKSSMQHGAGVAPHDGVRHALLRHSLKCLSSSQVRYRFANRQL